MSHQESNPSLIPQHEDHSFIRDAFSVGLQAGGAEYVDGQLKPTSEQIDWLAKQVLASDTGKPDVSQSNPTIESAETVPMTQERLHDILSVSYYGSLPYAVRGRELIEYPDKRHTNPALMRGLTGNQQSLGASKELQAFADAGTTEVVTVAPVHGFDFTWGMRADSDLTRVVGQMYGLKWEAGQQKGDDLYIFQYTTATSSNKNEPYFYGDIAGRKTSFTYTMLLPKSLAKELEGAVKQDPTLARRLGDMTINNPGIEQGTIGDRIGWDEYKPPYETWKEQGGGVAKMAFRMASHQTLKQSQIVEF